MSTTGEIIGSIGGILFIGVVMVGLFALLPWLTIASVNTLFGVSVPHNLSTYASGWVLYLVVRNATTPFPTK